MSAIVIANLSWHTPDNTSLFDNLNLTFEPVRTGLVGRNGTGKTTLLRLIAGEIAALTGKITTPPSVGFLRQDPVQHPDETLADLFGVRDQLTLLDRAERGEATAEDLADIDWTLEARLEAALLNLGLEQPIDLPIRSLSGGQRTSAGLAALMFAEPDVLLLDEPTNHLDRAGRRSVIDALRAWNGCVVVASHDRELLGAMDAIVELSRLGARSYGGNYDTYRQMKAAEFARTEAELARAEKAISQTQARAQLALERKARTDRQGKQLRASGSQSKLILNAAKERSQSSGNAAARLRRRQTQAAGDALEAAQKSVEILQPLKMDIPPSGLVAGRDVLRVDDLCFRYSGKAPLLQDVSFAIRGPERVAIEGRNGSGKSTLLACVHGNLQPQSGSVSVHVPMALLDQDLSSLKPEETVRDAFARLDPEAGENDRRAVLARFLFRGDDAKQKVGALSGGQRLRAGLACTLGHCRPRQLLLLDEPSNHLDIEAIEVLEAALTDYDGAILVVSHDEAFLQNIGVERTLSL
ncbi:ABC-F family ATP-binding cassette domain-containing protein [uncultured Roseibium sp.]|uniref:ABC-F family ATP-binding cassette domain-containing protein n=1 Tax=uncultured Roseibium sp. TaxID=1936171 RepID=UPI0026212E4E|nr:ABC-F family ATP-binding cassette domain-containing protein [uncultured Roseibium sp.]